MTVHKVVFNINQDYGYISLDETANRIEVFFPDPAEAKRIKSWLDCEHMINTPDESGGLSSFSTKNFLAANSAKDFNTVLTRAWENLGVHVNWSFPADCI